MILRDPVAGFLAQADAISRRERVCPLRAMQASVERHPPAFLAYREAFKPAIPESEPCR
jgi:hypothetical protein